jgi:hypothetical protein
MSLDALKAMRLAGTKPAIVWIYLCAAKQTKWWRYSDGIPEIVLADKPETARADFRPVVGCDVILMADQASSVLTAVTKSLQSVVSRLTVVIADRLPDQIGHEWTKASGWREVARG